MEDNLQEDLQEVQLKLIKNLSEQVDKLYEMYKIQSKELENYRNYLDYISEQCDDHFKDLFESVGDVNKLEIHLRKLKLNKLNNNT